MSTGGDVAGPLLGILKKIAHECRYSNKCWQSKKRERSKRRGRWLVAAEISGSSQGIQNVVSPLQGVAVMGHYMGRDDMLCVVRVH